MFEDLVKDLTEKGGSVRAYDACARAARARIAAEPENAAALLLIASAAQHFVDAYDDQPLTVEAAGEELAEFNDLVVTLDKAHRDGSPEVKLAALNKVAASLAATAKG